MIESDEELFTWSGQERLFSELNSLAPFSVFFLALEFIGSLNYQIPFQ